MDMKTFVDIFTLTKQRINFTDTDATIDSIIKSGINQAYLEIAKNEEPTVRVDSINVTDGIIELPDDLLDIIDIYPPLMGNYKKVGKYIVTQLVGSTTLTYSAVPDPLVLDTDIPVISKKYWYYLTSFGAYSYFMYKKKEQEASVFMMEYTSGLTNLRQKNKLSMGRRSYYADLLGGVGGGAIDAQLLNT